MRQREFGQYCGLARALELVGERWALLIIRDLTVRPHRYTDLLAGLPGIPTNVLATRLKELEQAGIIERRIAPAPQRAVVYALTTDGHNLEPVVLALGRWGATQLGEPRPGEIVTPDSLTMTLRSAFNQAEAAGLTASWELRAPDIVVHLLVNDGQLEAGVGPAPAKPDLVITFTPEDLPSYQELMQAAKCGLVQVTGQRKLLDIFIHVFTPNRSAQPLVKTA
jgi:DNA-binding HxlR family transcriptional regulator